MAERTADVQAHWTRPGVLARIDAALAELGQDPQILTPEILATVEHLHSGLAATRSVPLVRQHGQRVKLDSFLMQLLGLVRRGLPVNRAALDLARKVCSCLQETHSIPPARKRAGYVDS